MARPEAQPIKGVLAVRRISLREFSGLVKCNASSLSKILNGDEASWPALRKRCAEALNLPEEELFRSPR